MKILLLQYLNYLPSHGGANKCNRLLLEGLAQRGHLCRVIAPAKGVQGLKTEAQFHNALSDRGLSLANSPSTGVDIFYHKGVEVHAVTDLSLLRQHVVKLIHEFEPTWILVSSEDLAQLLLEVALESYPARVVYLAHTLHMLPFGPKSFLSSSVKTGLLQQVAGVITVSHFMKDYIKRWSGLESTVLPFPVYGAGPFPHFGCFGQGFVTAINPCAYKGLSIFLALANALPEVQFAAVPTWGTTSDERAALQQLPNVHVFEAVDNIDEVFAQTCVQLVPSLWDEAFGLSATEAMLRGIPVLASNSGALPEAKLGIDYVLPVRQIENYTDYFDERMKPIAIIPDQDISPWLSALREVLGDRSRYERLSTQSREAALVFVATVGIPPFEDYLERLVPRTDERFNPNFVPTTMNASFPPELMSLVDKLPSETLELLAWRLRESR